LPQKSTLAFAVAEGMTMEVTFNAFEVFEIAEQIERNGARFYHKATELFDAPAIRKMFLELANWEAKHQELFRDMRRRLYEQSGKVADFRAEGILSAPRVMAGLAVFGIRPDPSNELTGKETVADVLKKAIEKEKDSIVYYTGLKDFVESQNGRNQIDDIIKEEMRHIRILNESLTHRE
jgi:rubrerythrin